MREIEKKREINRYNIYIFIHIHIYIERERKKEAERVNDINR